MPWNGARIARVDRVWRGATTVNEVTPTRFTPLGRLLTIVLIAGLIALGVRMLSKSQSKGSGSSSGNSGSNASGSASAGKTPDVAEARTSVKALAPAAAY